MSLVVFPATVQDASSFELIDCRGDLSHIVVMKLRMARKRKALVRMGRSG